MSMMICEKCAKELLRGTVICRYCNHNNVLQRIDAWREKQNHRLATANQISAEKTASSFQLKHNSKDGMLIRFPKQPLPQPEKQAPVVSDDELPPWKKRLNARLQEIREQRAAEEEPPASSKSPVKLDRDPRIEAALNRINRANYIQMVTPARGLARTQTALAEEILPPQPEIQNQPEISAPIFPKAGQGNLKTAPKPLVPLVSEAPVINAPESIGIEAKSEGAFTLVEESQFHSQSESIGSPEYSAESGAEVYEEEVEATTEQGTLLEAASLRLRLAAAVIDAEIIALSFLPLFAVFAFFGGKFSPTETPFYILVAIAICLITLYFFLTYSLAGRTVGMGLLKLHLASRAQIPDHQMEETPSTITFTFQQAAARAFGGSISLLLFPLNVLCITRSYDRLSISDYLSNTQIVRIKK